MLRRRLGRGLSPARACAALRSEPGLVVLAGAWLGDAAGVQAIVAHGPRQVVTDAPGLLAVLDDLPTLPEGSRHQGAFGAGWLGLLGYPLGRHLEPVAPPAVEPDGPPGFLGWYEAVWCCEDGEAWFFEAIVEDGREAAVAARFEEDQARFDTATKAAGAPEPFALGEVRFEPSLEEHKAAVRAVKAYIEAGDVFQVNACCHALAPFEGDPVDLFVAGLERLEPRFGGFLRRPDGGAVCSLSPELFLRVEGRSVLTSPIKGTVRRPRDNAAAEAARAALLASAKDGAENAMIVDLMRNDLGRVCVPGSVRVAELARAEAHPGVWHLVSDVVGQLAPGESYGSLVGAAFPAGSITGAPKVRAMEIVSELEPVGRGAYTGSIGFVSPLAGMCWNVAIRTFEVEGGVARLGVGGGVVADSTVEAEVEECLTKARPLLEAAGGRLPEVPLRAPGDVVLRPRPARGVLETMRVVDGRIPLLDRHLARLAAAAGEVLGRPLPEELPARCLAAAPHVGLHRLRLVIRPGGASLRVELEATPLRVSSAADRTDLAKAIGLEPVEVAGGLGRHKWCDRRLLSSLRPATMAEIDQLLLVDRGGWVLEAERASLFAVIDGVLRTPGLDEPVLPGVARAVVLEAAIGRGLAVKEGRLGLAELDQASEVFVVNALRGLQRVGRIGERNLPTVPAPAAERLGEALEAALRTGPDRWGDPSSDLARPAAARRRLGAPVRSGAGAVGTHRWAPGGRGAGTGLVGPVVVVDNVDSFTFNLTQALSVLGASTVVVRSNAVSVEELAGLGPAAVVLSPGPCGPAEAGISVEVVRRLGPTVPILGVCLGHQCIAAAYGAAVVRAPTPVHGRTAPIEHDGSALFARIPSPFAGARYHSLIVDPASLPEDLEVSAHVGDLVMGLRHRSHLVLGVQFHPESFLTGVGGRLLENFLRLARR